MRLLLFLSFFVFPSLTFAQCCSQGCSVISANLFEMLKDGGVLGALRDQLGSPKLPGMMEQFPSYTKIKSSDYQKMFEAFKNKRKDYAPRGRDGKPREIILTE